MEVSDVSTDEGSADVAHRTGAADTPSLPSGLLMHLASDGGGEVVLVTGAGCSMPAPTGLKSGAAYSREAYRRLVLDGVIGANACTDPDDLSVLADCVYAETGSQKALTDRLPRAAWRNASPNHGHLIAAALLIEGALRYVLTLNYDLALQTSLALLGSSPEISICRGPEDHSSTGSRALIFLHRSAEASAEDWVLRKSDLDEAWRGGWEEMMATGALSAPLTLFAGLGSPAAVLTETVNRISAVGGSEYYLADPYPDNKFRAAIGKNLNDVITIGWLHLMECLSARIVSKQAMALSEALDTVAADIAADIPSSLDIDAFVRDLDIVSLGKLRASWALHSQNFMPDRDENARRMTAHLLLAVYLIAEGLETQARVEFEANGNVRLRGADLPDLYFRCAHGGGTRTMEAVRARVEERESPTPLSSRPRTLIVVGALTQLQSLPADLIRDETSDDLIRGAEATRLIAFEEIQATCLSDASRLLERLIA